MFEYFYHEILRSTIVAFGSLFNDISIKHTDDSDNTTSVIKVPLAYGPTQKFLARLEQSPNLNKPVQISLPRMSFEFTGLTYDPSRKVTTTQTFLAGLASDKTQPRKTFMPVPYNIGFELNIICKLNDDALQIVEQILPYFQPSFNITVNLVNSIGEKRDIPVVLDNISFTDDYEGDFSTRRLLIYTLTFTAKSFMFGPISETTEGLIRKVQVDSYTDADVSIAKRQMRYTLTPDPENADFDDDFGFSENWEYFEDGKVFSPTKKEDI